MAIRKKVDLSRCEIRGIRTRAEVFAVADLYGKAFRSYDWHYSRYVDFLLRRVPREMWRLSRVLWAPDGAPIAQIRVCDRTMRLGATKVRVGGIGDVATHPFYRRQGLMRHLFGHVLPFMRDEGYDISMLWGIPNFYDKFGYVVGLRAPAVEVSRAQLEGLRPPLRGRKAKRGDIPALLRLHEADAATRDGAMDRCGDRWARRAVRWGSCRVVEDDGGKPRAYYLWQTDDRAMVLNEVSLGTGPTRELVVSVLCDLARLARRHERPSVRLQVAFEHPLARFCVADGCEVHDHIPHRGGGMVRIINLEGLCEKLAPEWERLLAASTLADWRGRLRLKTDIGSLDLAISRGKVSPQRPEGRPDATLSASQDKLCRLVVGFHPPEAAAMLDEIRADRQALALANVLFPPRSVTVSPWDHF